MEVMRDINVAIMLVTVARCPNCEGKGYTIGYDIEAVCCGEPLGTGECCGNAIPEQVQVPEQCQWCAEKDELIAKYDNGE